MIQRRHQCLRAGQRCVRRLDRQYHRYGFHCHGARLTRRSAPPAQPPAPSAILDTIQLSAPAWDMAIGGGAIWVQVGERGAVRIDASSKLVSSRVEGVVNLAFAGAELWAAAGENVLQLDPASGAIVSTIPAAGSFHIAAGAGSLWVSGGDSVKRIDPIAKRVVATIPTPTCAGPRAVSFGHGSVWVGCTDSGAVVRIDPATNAVVTTIPTGAGAHHIGIGSDAAWVTNFRENTVSRIDPATNTAVAKVQGAGSGVGIAVADGIVWATTGGTLAKIDAARNAVVAEVQLVAAIFHYDVQLAEGSLWVSSSSGRIYQIDPNAVRAR